jgi:23S rRNA (guanosine2251-2'-O)-methyltransferase
MIIDSVIIHDIRSTHNVGSILRSCDGFGVRTVYIGGVSPYPVVPNDTRLPHISAKLTKDIHKTALGAENTITIIPYDDIFVFLDRLSSSGVAIVALEQSRRSIPPSQLTSDLPIALLLGSEVDGVDPKLLERCTQIIEIPMKGSKESFNVSVAAGIALYALCT